MKWPSLKIKASAGKDTPTLPFALAHFFSYVFFLVILFSSVVLALFIGNTMRTTLVDSQKEYALLLAQNMNKQIFRRFTLPVVYATGKVSLADPEQYQLLDEVVLSQIHGLRIETIRIFDDSYSVTYSTNKDEVRRTDLYTAGVPAIFTGGTHHFDVLSTVSFIRSLFTPKLEDGTFQLRTVFPLSIDLDLAPVDQENSVLGAMEIIQDVTNHYKLAIRSQWLIIACFALSGMVMFLLFQYMARRAESILAERMEHNRKLEAQLHQNDRLVSMGRVVASIAHEIRNPLGIIRSSAEFLLSCLKPVEASQELPRMDGKISMPILQAIYDESCRLGSTVNDFLDYARPRQPKQDKVDLVRLLEKALVFLRGEFERLNIRMVWDVPPSMTMLGDGEYLYRAFYNVLVNAQQAMGQDGEILVKGTVQEDGALVLTISDSGPGFPPGSTEKALDPFFTTKDSGTGLGLPIVQSIISSHGGTMYLSNSNEGGAVVTLVFPSYDG